MQSQYWNHVWRIRHPETEVTTSSLPWPAKSWLKLSLERPDFKPPGHREPKIRRPHVFQKTSWINVMVNQFINRKSRLSISWSTCDSILYPNCQFQPGLCPFGALGPGQQLPSGVVSRGLHQISPSSTRKWTAWQRSDCDDGRQTACGSWESCFRMACRIWRNLIWSSFF